MPDKPSRQRRAGSKGDQETVSQSDAIAASAPSTAFQHAQAGSPSSHPTYVLSTTHPEALGRHDISDEELEMVTQSPPDRLWEAMFTSAGVALGSSVPAITAVWSAYLRGLFGFAAKPLSAEDALQVVLFAAAVAVTVVCWHATKGRQSAVDKLKDDIRARPSSRALLYASDATDSTVTHNAQLNG